MLRDVAIHIQQGRSSSMRRRQHRVVGYAPLSSPPPSWHSSPPYWLAPPGITVLRAGLDAKMAAMEQRARARDAATPEALDRKNEKA